MKKNIYRIVVSLALSTLFISVYAQKKYDRIEQELNTLSQEVPALNKNINISVSGASIQEFIRAVGNNASVNINIDPDINIKVTNNFSNVKVMDILLFLCEQYNLEINTIGSIINIYKEEKPGDADRKIVAVQYDSAYGNITLDYKNEELGKVVKEITMVTNKNIVLAPGLESTRVGGYIQNMPFENGINKFAFTNGLKMSETEDGFYILEKDMSLVEERDAGRDRTGRERRTEMERMGTLEIKTVDINTISANVSDVPILDVLLQVSNQLDINYFITSEIKGNTTLNIKEVSYDSFLEYLLNGTSYTYKKRHNIYIIGEVKLQELMESKVIQLQHRSVDKVSEILPQDMTNDLAIMELPEINSISISGPSGRVKELETFIKEIDKIVPVVMIEVLIVDINKTYTLETGVETGLGEEPVVTKGSIYPGFDMTLSSQSINNLINSFNGFGSVNIGKVTPNFYMNIQAMENQGILKVRSTPKLSTLNGHEANLTIGVTEYYMEEQQSTYGGITTGLQKIQTYKSVNAEFNLLIKPFVSGDEQITLEIEVSQSDFTERINEFAPPGAVTRDFKSSIRVKNQEMILLGGLEEKRLSETGKGVPLLSRIPVLKWIFSKRVSEDTNSKLSIFIRPTIIN